MSIVLRKSGNEEAYVKPTKAIVKSLIRFGILKDYSIEHGYCDEADNVPRLFRWKDNLYKIEYMDGCFYPYLLEIHMGKENIRGWFDPKADMWENTNFPNFEAYIKDKTAYEQNDKFEMVLDCNKVYKEPLMTLEEAKDIMINGRL